MWVAMLVVSMVVLKVGLWGKTLVVPTAVWKVDLMVDLLVVQLVGTTVDAKAA